MYRMKGLIKCLLLPLVLLICLSTIQCQDVKLTCLSLEEKEYLQELHSVFEKTLIDHYGKLEKHDLIFNYVNDFSQLSIAEINTLFFQSFKIDTTAEEFHKLFIKYSQLPPEEDILDDDIEEVIIIGSGAIIDDKGNIIDVGDIDAIKEMTAHLPTDYYVINPNSSFVSCFLQQKSKSYKVNNLMELISVDVSPSMISGAISEDFKESEFKDELLQTYIMLHLFVLPKLTIQSM